VTDALHIVHVTPEMAPFLKTGGLADVSASLPKAQVGRGHRVTVILPRHQGIPYAPGEFVESADVPLDVPRTAGFYRTRTPGGVEVVFVEYAPFYDRPKPYGHDDDRLRYAFLARAALEYLRRQGERPSVVHAHDWQAGLVPVYLKSRYWDDPVLRRTPGVFTIHNVAYQGQFGLDTVGLVDLPEHLASPFALEYHGGASYLKGGTVFAEMVSTVSPTYALEIQGPEHGFGFQDVMRSRSEDVVGILNGVDYDEWDPVHDRHIAKPYGPRRLAGKAACKADLLRKFGLTGEPDLPVVAGISRLVWQKGFDIVADAWWDLVRRPIRMVFLGSGDDAVQAGLAALVHREPTRFAAYFGYDETLSHRVMAGADIFLMPSRSEPCGLTQMYAMRYGTVPVVRSTGGLVDTVEPYDGQGGTGFRFDSADGTGLLWALDQALTAHADPKAWAGLMQRGMVRDFSWDRSAEAYEELYARARRQV
jgi:starch synthase